MFDNAQDADRFLSGSICLYGGAPIYIDRVDHNMRVRARTLPLGQTDYTGTEGLTEFQIDDLAFNYTTFTLGYANFEREANFVMRTPYRGNTQGLCAQNMKTEGSQHRIDASVLYYTEGFRNMLQGVYPSFTEAVATLQTDARISGRAFSRNFAVRRHPEISKLIHMCYKGRDIGWGDGDRFTIGEEHTHLGEVIEAAGARVV